MKKMKVFIITLLIISISFIITYKTINYFEEKNKMIKEMQLEQYKEEAAKEERQEKIEKAKAKKELRNKEPYIGLKEKYINYTSWGVPDETELSDDYFKMQERNQFTYYRWNDGGLKFREITVHKGKVWEITISDNKGMRTVSSDEAP